MSSHERIVAPKIVQPTLLGTVLKLAVLLLLLAAVAWLSYDYGRMQSLEEGGAASLPPVPSCDREDALEIEVSTLKHRIDELQDQIDSASCPEPASPQTPDDASASTTTAPEQESTKEAVVESEPAAVEVAASAEVDELRISAIQLQRMGSANSRKLSFTVEKTGESTDQVTGSIWIAVNGSEDGQSKRLPFKEVSSDGSNFVAMRFKNSQPVQSVITLPAGFVAHNLVVEVNPAGDKYGRVSATHAWKKLR